MNDLEKKAHYIALYNLQPHPEGGFYRETYRSSTTINIHTHSRNISTAIYFLLDEGNFSALHKITSDEIWHFYDGDPLEVIEINDAGELHITTLGNANNQHHFFQHVVKANTWFGSRVKKGGTFSLLGCTVAPGFDFADFEMGEQSKLLSLYPQHTNIIQELTR